jgi:hypothetical protein
MVVCRPGDQKALRKVGATLGAASFDTNLAIFVAGEFAKEQALTAGWR